MGERYTICDPYLFTLAQWLEADGVDPERIPKVIDHRRRVSERAARVGAATGDRLGELRSGFSPTRSPSVLT